MSKQAKKSRSGQQKDVESISECSVSEHCDCCITQTIKERYIVHINRINDEGQVSVGDQTIIKRVENFNFISDADQPAVLLDPVASDRLVTELLRRYDQDREEQTTQDELPLNPQNLPFNKKGRDVSKLLSLFKQMKGKQQLSENPPKNKIVTLPKSKGVQQTATEVVDFGFIEVDGGAQTEDEEERGEEAANSLPNKSERKGSITFEVYRTVQTKIPKEKRRKINGVLLSLCGAFCTLPVAVVIIWFIFYEAGLMGKDGKIG